MPSFCLKINIATDSKVIGAFVFPIGLILICNFGYFLYTGKICYLFDELKKKEKPWKDYKKGKLSFEQQEHLWENLPRAKNNILHEQVSDKPFSMMPDFINVLEENK